MKKYLVVLEGIPGSGKTTLMNSLQIPHFGPNIERIKQIIPDNPEDDTNMDLKIIIDSDYSKTKLSATTYCDLVIFDRYYLSTLAYQYAYDKVTGEKTFNNLQKKYNSALNRGGLVYPDLTFYIDTPITMSLNRKKRKNNNIWTDKIFLNHQKDFYSKVKGLHIIDGKKTLKDIKSEIEKIIGENMNKKIIKKVSAGGVLHDDGKYLIIYWKSEDKYELPKGSIENDESPAETCVREMLEETGYNVEVTNSLGSNSFVFDWKDGNTYKKTVHYFLTKRTDNLEPNPNREANEDFENLWVSYDDAMRMISFDDMREIIVKAKKIIEKY